MDQMQGIHEFAQVGKHIYTLRQIHVYTQVNGFIKRGKRSHV